LSAPFKHPVDEASPRRGGRLSFVQYGRFFAVGLFVGILAIVLRELIARALPADSPTYYSVSVVLVYAAGILLAFVLHSRYTFGVEANSTGPGKLAPFVAVALVGAFVTWLVSFICRYALGFDAFFGALSGSAAFAAGAVTASLVSYALNAHVVFGRGAPGSDARHSRLTASSAPHASTSTSGAGDGLTWRTHASFMFSCSAACIAWSWWAGRDLNWDQLNYHFYAAYHLLDGRVGRDFMGASIQGYLNPLAYVPFYLMVRANWHSLLIGSTLALMHSTCLWLVYGISRELIPAQAPFRIATIAAAVALAFLAPIYLVEIGSTFIDVTTTIPVLAGILLLMTARRSRSGRWLVLAAGLAMGAAAGLKLTNAIFPVAASTFIVVSTRTVKARVVDGVVYVAGGIAGFLLVEGAWAYRLYRTFGNPFFPYLNGWFRSPDFPPFNIANRRFSPESIGDYVLLPMKLLDLNGFVYTETMSPDIRFLVLFGILATAGAMPLVRRRQRNAGPAAETRNAFGSPVYFAALAFTLISYVLWLGSSGNGRYALALELFIAPMIVASLLLVTRSRRILVYFAGGILLVQAAIVQTSVAERWTQSLWKSAWYDLDIPPLLQQRAFLYLSLEKQTAGFLAPFLNAESAFVNLVGQQSLALDRPGGERLRSLLDRHRPDVRTLIMVSSLTETREVHPDNFAVQDSILERVGLRADRGDCLSIVVHDNLGNLLEIKSASTLASFMWPPEDTTFLTCATRPLERADESAHDAERRARADRVFDLLEARCPRLFSPARPYTDRVNRLLGRNYVNTDARLWESGGLIQYSRWRSGAALLLGRTEDVLDGRTVINCRSLGEHP